MSVHDPAFADIEPVNHDPRGEISAEIAEAVRRVREDLMNEINGIYDDLASLQRTLDSRTEHLA